MGEFHYTQRPQTKEFSKNYDKVFKRYCSNCGKQCDPEKARIRHSQDGISLDFCCAACMNEFKADRL